MCGIAGFIEKHRSQSTEHILDNMLDVIAHRGPDDCGTYRDSRLSMGMRRLSIIAVDDGKQPIFDETRRFALVFNGEIYNYIELRKMLLDQGHQFSTSSDTEVIVHLYEEYGADCLEHLRGMFAFAIWDSQKEELFIARDRIGIKPLYFSEASGGFVFGSEIKSLLQHPGINASLDYQALSLYLSLKYVPAPLTMFAGISSLPPGHWLKFNKSGLTIEGYWDIAFEKDHAFEDETTAVDRLEELLEESIRLRLRSDVPFGAFLSGGLDSSIIVALMAKRLNSPVNTFSVGFEQSEGQDELPYAKRVASEFGCIHHTIRVTGQDFLEHANTTLAHLDQPIADQATIATYMLSQLASKHVKMVLTGEGGDELFAGYARYAGERLAPWLSWCPEPLRRFGHRVISRVWSNRRLKIATGALQYANEAKRHANWFPMLADDVKAEMLSDAFANYRQGAATTFASRLADSKAQGTLDRMLYCDSKMWLPDHLLLRGDKLTMANSIEARVPLLDHPLVEFAAALPEHFKLHGKTRKYLLKKYAERILPKEIVHRQKQGFPIPIDRWLNVEANEMMHDLLSPQAIAARGIFNTRSIENMIQRHEASQQDYATELWGIMSVEMWLRKFVDSSEGASYQPSPLRATVAV